MATDLRLGASPVDPTGSARRPRHSPTTLAADLNGVWQSLRNLEPDSEDWSLHAAGRSGDRHERAMWHLVSGAALQAHVSPRAGLVHLRQAEAHFRALSMRDMCQAVRVEAALHIREAGFSALALSLVENPAALEVDHYASSVHAARALCLLDLGQVEAAAASTQAAHRALTDSRREISLRMRWYFVLASLQLRTVASLLKRPFECHLTEPFLGRGKLDVSELTRMLGSLSTIPPFEAAPDTGSICREATALVRLWHAAESPRDAERESGLIQLATDFALKPQGLGAQAWLWLGTTQLLLGRPKSAAACLQHASSFAAAHGWVRVQMAAQIELVHAYERSGQSVEALAAHKELRSLESSLRYRSVPPDWTQHAPEAWTGPDPSGLQNAHLRRAIGLMSQDQRQFSVDSLAQACGVSRRTLEKAFRAELGQSVADCLRGRRLAMVRAKLLLGNDSIKRIALETGYPSASALCHDFKRATGITPARYRTEAEKGGDTE